jgi:ribosomal protein S18 acetylase RimI-like enzyme
MVITRLTPEHGPAYRSLMLQAYALHPDAFTTSATERQELPLSFWANRLANQPDSKEVVFGAIVDGELAGVAGLSFEVREKTHHKATLFGMYVQAGHRKSGLGRQLVAAVLDHAKQNADTLLVQLTVTEGNVAAQSLYESFGFVTYGMEPMAVRVGDAYVSKVHMWCDLHKKKGR